MRTRNAPSAIKAAPRPRMPVESPVFVEGRFETPATAAPACGLDWNPATAVPLFADAATSFDGAVCTEATAPFGPKPGAQVIGPAGITAAVVPVPDDAWFCVGAPDVTHTVPEVVVVSCVFACASTPTLVLRSEEHTSELQSQSNLVCRLLPEHKT